MYNYTVSANGTQFGVYAAADEQGARDLCARDAGYEDEADMVKRLGRPSDLIAESPLNRVEYYKAGDAACVAGMAASDCPHSAGVARTEWLRGFADRQETREMQQEAEPPAQLATYVVTIEECYGDRKTTTVTTRAYDLDTAIRAALKKHGAGPVFIKDHGISVGADALQGSQFGQICSAMSGQQRVYSTNTGRVRISARIA